VIQLWTGSELVFFPTDFDVRRLANSYRPATGQWRVLEHLPPAERGALWNGTAIVGYAEPAPQGPRGEPAPAGAYRYVPPPG